MPVNFLKLQSWNGTLSHSHNNAHISSVLTSIQSEYAKMLKKMFPDIRWIIWSLFNIFCPDNILEISTILSHGHRTCNENKGCIFWSNVCLYRNVCSILSCIYCFAWFLHYIFCYITQFARVSRQYFLPLKSIYFTFCCVCFCWFNLVIKAWKMASSSLIAVF